MRMIGKKFAAALVLAVVTVSLGHVALRERFGRIAPAERSAADVSSALGGERPLERKDGDKVGETSITPTPAVKTTWPGGRHGTRAGFSAELPEGAVIEERDQDARAESGAARKVIVHAADDTRILSARLQSADFGVRVADGCCDTFIGTLDIEQPDDAIHAQLARSFKDVFVVRQTVVGGRAAMRFYSPFRYADTTLMEHVLIPTGDASFPTLQFSAGAGATWGPEDTEPEFTDASVRALASPDAAERFTRMLDTVIFIPIPAQ